MRSPEGTVYLFAVQDENGDDGYVTACQVQCAKEVAARIGMRLMADDWFAEEDDRGMCDACGFPDPSVWDGE